MMRRVGSVLRLSVFVLLAVASGIGPWFFGAWEMWWFWLFTAVLAAGIIVLGGRLLLCGGRSIEVSRRVYWVGAAALPFLGFAILRMWQDSVYMDAERSVLLHVTGVGVGVLVAFGLTSRQRRQLFAVLFSSLLAMAVYGVLNHFIFESRYVLWVPRYEQYAGRATGPYFCPDHFAGAMELLFCMCAGLLLDCKRHTRGVRWFSGVAGALAVVAVLLSKSRGAGLTLVVLISMILCWGFVQWPQAVRWYWRMIVVSLSLLSLLALLMLYPGYAERFKTYGGLHHAQATETETLGDAIQARLLNTSRGRMYGGAWRAWKSAPWLGIGPGMHQNRWPQFAATADGNRELGIWPTQTNDDFHSYEVHNDWLQLLEEYGVVGMMLFMVPFLLVLYLLRREILRERHPWRDTDNPVGEGFAYRLSGGLALVAMAFHSLGDFNLQMPGTVWLLAVLVTIPLAGQPMEVANADHCN